MMATLPKFALEAVTLSTVMLVVIYMIAFVGDFRTVLPLIGVYAFAAFRLMPSLKAAFQHLAKMRSNEPVVDLVAAQFPNGPPKEQPDLKRQSQIAPLPLRNAIELRSLRFNYPSTDEPAIRDLSLRIERGTTVGLVGPTGCGKTTTVDILLGLLAPQQGGLYIDDERITDENLRRWQVNLGYVPQNIYLSDNSLARNIAFGIPRKRSTSRPSSVPHGWRISTIL